MEDLIRDKQSGPQISQHQSTLRKIHFIIMQRAGLGFERIKEAASAVHASFYSQQPFASARPEVVRET
jgi:hypothetical protein